MVLPVPANTFVSSASRRICLKLPLGAVLFIAIPFDMRLRVPSEGVVATVKTSSPGFRASIVVEPPPSRFMAW